MWLLSLLLVTTGWTWSAEENLVVNPGFEEGTTGWASFWARDTGAGTAAVVAEGAHDGKACLRIEHQGKQDWSWSQAAPVPVKPGDVFRIGGWVRVEKVEGEVVISTILRDGKNEVVDWSYGALVARQAADWQKLERRFVTPSGGASLVFRVIGAGPCVAWVDDLALYRQGNLSDLRRQTDFGGLDLETEKLKVHLDPELGIDVLDKRTNLTWKHSPALTSWVVLSVTKTRSSATLKVRDVLTDTEGVLKITLDGVGVGFHLDAPARPGGPA